MAEACTRQIYGLLKYYRYRHGKILDELVELETWRKTYGDEAARRFGVEEGINQLKEELKLVERNLERLEKTCLGLKIVEV
jgi:hypothetical protein